MCVCVCLCGSVQLHLSAVLFTHHHLHTQQYLQPRDSMQPHPSPASHPQPLATTHLLSLSVIMLLHECSLCELIPHVSFCSRLLSLSILSCGWNKLMPVPMVPSMVPQQASTVWLHHSWFYHHPLNNIQVVSNIWLFGILMNKSPCENNCAFLWNK